eukprot:Skav216656  [mRNA]  locus=scaffold1255:495691:497235:- [translate_table: standard]
MVQADSSERGDHFERYSASNSGLPWLGTEDLLTVYTTDGKGTRWTRLVEEQSPKQVVMTI